MTNECTCHISNLKCKNEKCILLITARGLFKSEINNILQSIMKNLYKEGFAKKECVKALRRELNNKNNIQYDIFDQVADRIFNE